MNVKNSFQVALLCLFHHHHHLSLNHESRRGTTDDSTTGFLHFYLFSTTLWDLANSGPVHSLMLSSHLFLCLACLLPSFTVPCKMVFGQTISGQVWPNSDKELNIKSRQLLKTDFWILSFYWDLSCLLDKTCFEKVSSCNGGVDCGVKADYPQQTGVNYTYSLFCFSLDNSHSFTGWPKMHRQADRQTEVDRQKHRGRRADKKTGNKCS